MRELNVMDANCGDCVFSEPAPVGREHGKPLDCHRFPPSGSRGVEDGDWCGEFVRQS